MVTANNTVAGNFIGTDITGTRAIGNNQGGVFVDDADNNVIGGTTPGVGNVISGNSGFAGVFIDQSFPGGGGTGNRVEGNRIGTDVTGRALGNQSPGVVVEGGRNNVIGGTVPGAGNVVAFNIKGVVVIKSPYSFATGPTSGNSILGNEIYDNAGLGIDLGGGGSQVANDSQGHNGPNNFEDFPVLTQVSNSSTSNTVSVAMDGTPGTTYRIEFFANDPPNPASIAPGQMYLGFVNAATDENGHASFDYTYTPDATHPFLTATATDSGGNTSEFSGFPFPPPPIIEASAPPPTVDNAPLAIAAAPAAATPAPPPEQPAAPAAASTEAPAVATELTVAVTSATVSSVSTTSGGEAVSARPPSTSTPVAEAPITVGISFDSSDRVAPPAAPGLQSASAPLTVFQAVEASQPRPPGLGPGPGKPGERTVPRTETQLLVQSTSLVAATLDGDDSVNLVEDLLGDKSEPAPKTEFSKPDHQEAGTEVARPEPASGATEPVQEMPDASTNVTDLLKRLAIPVVLVGTAAGWIGYRVWRGRKGQPSRSK